ncbi:2OG-Fe(II) oxygenase [Phenylobacterium sp. VNQ135]|uniref:2OG-Fe(II) oxygenase n=1 Tax=Phenylobacterium sp. VNQ135 TaxID=3400922 RepID=UPI003C02A8EE
MPLQFGEPAPWFTAPTASSPEFLFDSAAGRYVLMLFLPAEPQAAGGALKALAQRQQQFDDARCSAFVVAADPALLGGLQDLHGIRWMPDAEGRIAGAFQAEAPHWLLLDPALRVMDVAPLADAERILARVTALGPPGLHAGAAVHAPVLTAPRIFEPELCEALIGLHADTGGTFTGVMRDDDDRTVHVMDELKKRRDVMVRDPGLVAALRERLERRLFPFIGRAFGFQPTRIERYLVSCYDEADGGVFRPHRDNTTQGTAHRVFACSINLNDDFEGGDLRFPEFGPATYRPPVGGAVVFACGLMHEALPVTKGRRYAFLPFLYDEAGADVLAAYQARTGETPR